MVSRNVRNKVNKFLYTKKRETESKVLENVIDLIKSKKYIIRVKRLDTINTGNINLSSKFGKVLNNIGTMIPIATINGNMNSINEIILDKRFNVHSHVLRYKVHVFNEQDDISQLDNNFEKVRSKSLINYLHKYIRSDVLEHYTEWYRKTRVKLKLEEPNEEERKERYVRSEKNKENKKRNETIVLREVPGEPLISSLDKKDTTSEKLMEHFRFRRKANSTEQNKKLIELKEEIEIDKKKKEPKSFNFVLNLCQFESTVFNKLKTKTEIKKEKKHMFVQEKQYKSFNSENIKKWIKDVTVTNDS